MQLQKPKTNEHNDKRSKKLNKTQKPVQTDKFLMQTYESKGKGELRVGIRGRKEWQRKKLYYQFGETEKEQSRRYNKVYVFLCSLFNFWFS